MDNLKKGVDLLPGIGPKKKKLLESLGLYTVEDVLLHAPIRYEDRETIHSIADLYDGEKVAICARLLAPLRVIKKPGKTLYAASVSDGTGILHLVWQNMPYLARALRPGAVYTFYGRVSTAGSRLQMFSPLFSAPGMAAQRIGRIVPIYPAGGGVSQGLLLQAIEGALAYLSEMQDLLPPPLLEAAGVYPIGKALFALHQPQSLPEAEKGLERLKFEELFLLSVGMQMQRKSLQTQKGIPLTADMQDFLSALPFVLTDGQKSAIQEICRDMQSGRPMNRLLEGDVGSGKTVVAAAALYVAAKSGKQGVLLAPTEILARQHASSLRRLLPQMNICLLTGRLTPAERRAAVSAIRDGSAEIIVGTQALLNEKLPLSRVAVAVVDEQHRFGVRQRGFLSSLSPAPHILVMSATPIPRTLSLAFYGDLDVSVLPSRPAGRQPIETYCVPPTYRKRIYAFIRKALEKGNRAYILCPLAEGNEDEALCNVMEYAASIACEFKEEEILALHGRMKNKEEIMERFSTGRPKILVSTTVVEVGVDVPDATIMVIEHAERFGLSQLHQLRGRVGRGTEKSYCILVSNPKTATAKERLATLQKETDGFRLAEADLRLRGPGEFFGTRQHGDVQLAYADLFADSACLSRASALASALTADDPTLSKYPQIRMATERLYRRFAMN